MAIEEALTGLYVFVVAAISIGLSIKNEQMKFYLKYPKEIILLVGNNLGKLKSHTFIGRKNLETLYLNHSNIQVSVFICF